jgi:hypothetical protein
MGCHSEARYKRARNLLFVCGVRANDKSTNAESAMTGKGTSSLVPLDCRKWTRALAPEVIFFAP